MRSLRCLAFLTVLAAATPGLSDSATQPAKSQWVYPGNDGKLVYKTLPKGDKIMDFSHAGYMGGGVALPNVAVQKTVAPSGGDDTANIHAAIKAVADLPLKNGFRGAVLLAPGVYTCSEPINIAAAGVVLRGSASKGDKRSTIKLTGKPHIGITVAGKANGMEPFKDAKTKIADAYVPSGAMSFNVADAKGFAAGDTITIRKTVTAEWVKFMQMDDLVRDGKKQTWLAVGRVLSTERTIKAVDGKKITLDAPVPDSYDTKFAGPKGTEVFKIRPTWLTQIGIEHLHIECPPQPIEHTKPHFKALDITGQDCWARDVRCDETMTSVTVHGRRITLQQVFVHRKAMAQGASRPGEIAPDATQTLVDRCGVTADNVWFVWTGSGICGPLVLLNCNFVGDSRVETHHRWATAMLYDSCQALSGSFEFRNRGAMGSGHGWSMGWGVAWNCTAKEYIIQNPPGSANWLIGSIGKSKLSPRPFDKGPPNLPEGILDSHGVPVAPQSLYLSQLAERLGAQALKNIEY
ncbi:MAG TPA: hypothetical protein VE988_14345 [Gemmataceae bacterium]|nr:hypothetical protein [Gemmataceae bacterium]